MFGRKKENQRQLGNTNEPQQVSHHVERKVPELTTMVCTSTGNRKYQQDAVYVTPSKVLASNKKTRVMALVCDGMGGMADGGKASQTAGFGRLTGQLPSFPRRMAKVPERQWLPVLRRTIIYTGLLWVTAGFILYGAIRSNRLHGTITTGCGFRKWWRQVS